MGYGAPPPPYGALPPPLPPPDVPPYGGTPPPYAPPGRERRLFAFIIDAVLISIVTFILLLPLNFMLVLLQMGQARNAFDPSFEFFAFGTVTMIQSLVTMAVWFLYFSVLERRDGQTPGKRVLHVRVLSNNGTPAAPHQIVRRGLVHALYAAPLLLGLLLLIIELIKLFGPSGRTIADEWSGTTVVDATPELGMMPPPYGMASPYGAPPPSYAPPPQAYGTPPPPYGPSHGPPPY